MRINIHAPRRLLRLQVVAQEVDVEDEGRFRRRGEPVNIVLAVGDGGRLAGSEGAVERRLDEIVVLVILNAVVMPALEQGQSLFLLNVTRFAARDQVGQHMTYNSRQSIDGTNCRAQAISSADSGGSGVSR